MQSRVLSLPFKLFVHAVKGHVMRSMDSGDVFKRRHEAFLAL